MSNEEWRELLLERLDRIEGRQEVAREERRELYDLIVESAEDRERLEGESKANQYWLRIAVGVVFFLSLAALGLNAPFPF